MTIVLAHNYLIVNLWDLAPSCIHVMCKLPDQILYSRDVKKIYITLVLEYFVMFCSYLLFCYKINFLLTENGENLIGAQPRISAHPESPKIK